MCDCGKLIQRTQSLYFHLKQKEKARREGTTIDIIIKNICMMFIGTEE